MKTEAQKAFLWKSVDRRRAAFDARGQRLILQALNKQIAPVIVAIEQGKDAEKAISEKPIQEAITELYVMVGVHFAKEQYGSLKSHESDYLTKADAEESVWIRFMRRFALEKAGDRIKAITETTLKKVRSVLEEAAKEGLSIPNTAKLMIDEFNGINKQRATVIARTEIVSSSNRGSLLGAQSTGLKLNKEWLSTRDSRTRESHIAVDGQTVDLEGLFKVNGAELEHPGDGTHGAPASELVMCRCTQVYVPK
ncbi:phage minor head protein [Rufibacter roseus]|uniref:Phage minor head protein n=1 Tax=Rufibacter roseus TaxID=1567108 RepID=A0ABW2DM03_9BACT|nr:phage minor head protein [Rufibacter roseus]